MINIKTLKWCAYSLAGLFAIVVIATTLGTLVAGKQFMYNLQQMDRAEAHKVIISTYLSYSTSMGLDLAGTSYEYTSKELTAIANTYLDRKINKLTLLDKFILGVKPSKAFEITGKVIASSCTVFLIWLELWQAKRKDKIERNWT